MMWKPSVPLLNYLQMCKFPKHTIRSILFFCAKFIKKNITEHIFNNASTGETDEAHAVYFGCI